MKNFLGSFLIASLIVFNSSAQGYNELAKIVSTNPNNADKFGFSVAVDGHFAIIGAPGNALDINESNSKFNAGAAYVLERDHLGIWNIVQKITNSDRAAYDLFGSSVAIDGNKIVVGAWGNCFNSVNADSIFRAGAIYVFERNVSGIWNQTQKLVASDRHQFDYFGKSVAIHGDYIISGAFGNDYDAAGANYIFEAGAAYLFKNNGSQFVFHQKIVANDRGFHDDFGEKVAINGNVVAVGARFDNDDEMGANPLNSAGSGYVFEKDGADNWVQVKKMVASDRNLMAQFGYSIAVEGNVVVVGAKDEGYNTVGAAFMSNAGAAYIFTKNAGVWSQTQKIVASDRDQDDFFGFSVAISNGIIVVGASHDEHNQLGVNPVALAGSAYIFRPIGAQWGQTQKIVSSDRAVEDHFGVEVAISGGYLLVGADLKNGVNLMNDPITVSGAAYFFNECNDNTGQFSVTACGSYIWNDTTYTTSGTHFQTLVNYYGCDSIVELTLTIQPLPSIILDNEVSVCTGNPITLTASGGITYSWSDGVVNGVPFVPLNSQYYYVTATNALGCENIDSIWVGVYDVPQIELFQLSSVLCPFEDGLFYLDTQYVGTSYQIDWIYDGVTITLNNDSLLLSNIVDGGVLVAQLNNLVGCVTTITSNSISTQVLTVDTAYVSYSICMGDSIMIANNYYNNAGVFEIHTTSFEGCDSVIVAQISLIPSFASNETHTICEGDVFVFGSLNLTNSGTYTELFTNQFGCDSTITLHLIVLPEVTNENLVLCNGSTYTFGTQLITTAGNYTETFLNYLGCDSIVNLTVAIGSNYTINIETSICANQQYVLGSQILTAAGLYTEVFESQFGCDSVVNVILSINALSTTSLFETICSGSFFEFGNITPTATGTYVQTFTNILGCDSIVTLELFVTPAPITTQSVNLCAGDVYMFGSQSITQSGVYTLNHTAQNGCDSLEVLSALFYGPTTHNQTVIICPGAGYNFNEVNLTIPGIYTSTFFSQFGCDSTVILDLQFEVAPVISAFSGLLWVNQGQSFVWYKDGELIDGEVFQGYTPTEDGVYSVDVVSNTGCLHTISYTVFGMSLNPIDSFNITFYPNPANDFLTIETASEVAINWYNTIGELVLLQTIISGNQVVDITALPKGTYLLEITNLNSEKTFKKIVKM